MNHFAIAIFLTLVTYVPTFIWMWERWFSRDSYYTHGILVPIIAIVLIWQKRALLKTLPLKSSSLGLPLIILGLAIHLLSALFRVYFTSGFSLILVLAGLVLYFLGRNFLKQIAFPVSFLFFMIPLPMVIIANLSFKLKLLAAHLAVGFLNSQLGIKCIQQGSGILMNNALVVVDDVCGGLRSMISLAALGALFAYWLQGGITKRMILFLSTIPIAIITNVFRIILLAIICQVWGTATMKTFIHEFSGFLVFILAFILLYVVKHILE